MDIIFSASIIAAFLAGIVALFAPCCITVLLPAYLASAFREKKHMVKMTFVFFSGIAVILVPIGLGAAWLAEIFRDFHKEMYLLGGVFMLALAALSISGKGLTLIPMPKKIMPSTDMSHVGSVFFLGILSGAATSCCAPVLAGAMALAVLSGAFWKAIVVTFAYVFGMTFPLFIAACVYDRFKIENSKFIIGKIVEFKIGSKVMYAHSTNILAGAVFLVMGAVLLTLAFTENAFWSPTLQANIGKSLNLWSQKIFSTLSIIPEFAWGIIIIGIFIFFVSKMKK